MPPFRGRESVLAVRPGTMILSLLESLSLTAGHIGNTKNQLPSRGTTCHCRSSLVVPRQGVRGKLVARLNLVNLLQLNWSKSMFLLFRFTFSFSFVSSRNSNTDTQAVAENYPQVCYDKDQRPACATPDMRSPFNFMPKGVLQIWSHSFFYQ